MEQLDRARRQTEGSLYGRLLLLWHVTHLYHRRCAANRQIRSGADKQTAESGDDKRLRGYPEGYPGQSEHQRTPASAA